VIEITGHSKSLLELIDEILTSLPTKELELVPGFNVSAVIDPRTNLGAIKIPTGVEGGTLVITGTIFSIDIYNDVEDNE